METEFTRITEWARVNPKEKFNSLLGKVFNLAGLHESFRAQRGNKAPGIDGIRKDEYAAGLEQRLESLSARIRRMGYRPPAVRRVYIPK